MSSLQPVWVIRTRFGDAVRSLSDTSVAVDESISLNESCSVTFIPTKVSKEMLSTALFSVTDFPDPYKKETEISNVCGFVAGFSSLLASHPAWRTVRSTLGSFKEAYSLRGGNLLFLRGKLIFKGATCRQGVYDTVSRLISDPSAPILKAYLIIATAYMQRNLFVHNGCLLEEMLSHFTWCRVMHRHEEMSNAVIFYINSWASFQLPTGRPAPDMGTVTVSRRGVVNVRLGWHDGVEWDNNDEWVALVNSIRDFLLTLC